jgi:hypothetical protein
MKLIALLPLFLFLLAPATTMAAPDRWGCDGLVDYQTDIVTVLDPEDMTDLFDLMNRLDTLRPSQLVTVSGLLDDWATGLEDMPLRDIPRAARPYHEALILNLGLLSAVTSSMATGGVFGAIAYTDALEEAADLMDDANTYGTAKCGSDWPFGESEGSTL